MKCSWPRRTASLNPWPAFVLLAAVLSGLAPGQTPPTADDATITFTPAKTVKVADLASRYKFVERYTSDDEKVTPGAIGPYRVAIVEVSKDSFDSPQGAPKRTETSRQSIFTERPLEVSGLGGVASVSRSFEQFRVKPQDPAKTMGGRPFEGLAVAVRPKLGDQSQLVSLTPGRLLTEFEFDTLSRQLFVPQIASLLPSQAVRVGDGWRVSRKAAQAMLGDPSIQGDNLLAKLAEIRKELDGPRMVASITVGGRASGPAGEITVNAEVLFTFLPESTVKAPIDEARFHEPGGRGTYRVPGSDHRTSSGQVDQRCPERPRTAPLPVEP